MPKRSFVRHDRRLRWGDGWIEPRTATDGTPRWRARWIEVDATGREHKRSATFGSVHDAEQHLHSVTDRMASGRYVPPSDLTVTELIAQWIERGAYGWKPSTVAVHRQKARHQVIPLLGSVKVISLTTGRVQHWIDQLVKQGLAANTIDKAVQCLNGAFLDAVRLSIVPSNPVTGTRRPPTRQPPLTIWSPEEVQRVLASLVNDPLWFAAYRLALATGMRPGELRVLKWSDIDLVAGVVTVRRTMTKDRDGRQIIGTTTKTGRQRAIAIETGVIASLTAWRQEQRQMRVAAERWEDGDFVFTSRYGRILSQNAWMSRLIRIIAETGVPKISLHGLRHSSASLELDMGTHIKVVQERLGHVSAKTTLDTYSHVSTELQRAAAKVMDTRLFGAENTTTSGTNKG